MKNKEASSTIEALKKLLEYNLKFHNPETRRKMKREKKYDQIGSVISDNGLEFKGSFSEFLKQNNASSTTCNLETESTYRSVRFEIA